MVLRSPGALGSVPCCLCCQLFGEHSEKLWLVMIHTALFCPGCPCECEECRKVLCISWCSDQCVGFACVCFGMRQAFWFLMVSEISVKPETGKVPDWCRGKEETVFGAVGMVQSFPPPFTPARHRMFLCPIHSTSGQAKCGRSWMFFPLNSMLIDHMQCLQTLNTQALCCSISA